MESTVSADGGFRKKAQTGINAGDNYLCHLLFGADPPAVPSP